MFKSYVGSLFTCVSVQQSNVQTGILAHINITFKRLKEYVCDKHL